MRGRSGQFQSLSGFLMSCNRAAASPARPAPAGFQSLSGFLMSCNPCLVDHLPEPVVRVSIPIGFSNEL